MLTSDDVMLNKAAIIERSIKRILEEYSHDPGLENLTHVDAMILNIERACQAAIDMAMHIVATRRLGSPQSSADAFALLEKAGLISRGSLASMAAMTAFRNIAIHEYQSLDKGVLKTIAGEAWKSLVEYCSEIGITIRPNQSA